MQIWSMSDFHLSFSSNKPMDIFGKNWYNHDRKMARNWDKVVGCNDVVICPGDISWALKLDKAKDDLKWISKRPGLKILTRGNHDFWWNSLFKVKNAMPKNCIVLQNDAYDLGEVVVAGCRGWSVPGALDFTKQDYKIYERELLRLRMSLEVAKKLAPNKPIIVSIHYPPFTAKKEPTNFTKILNEFKVSICVHGHLHGGFAHKTAVHGLVNGVFYKLVVCDFINFTPTKVWPVSKLIKRVL